MFEECSSPSEELFKELQGVVGIRVHQIKQWFTEKRREAINDTIQKVVEGSGNNRNEQDNANGTILTEQEGPGANESSQEEHAIRIRPDLPAARSALVIGAWKLWVG